MISHRLHIFQKCNHLNSFVNSPIAHIHCGLLIKFPRKQGKKMKRNLACLLLFMAFANGLQEQGIWHMSFNKNYMFNFHGVYKSMFQGTKIALKVECPKGKEVKLRFGWMLRYSPCAEEFLGLESNLEGQRSYYDQPWKQMIPVFEYTTFEYMKNETSQICKGVQFVLPDLSNGKPTIYTERKTTRAAKPKKPESDKLPSASQTTAPLEPPKIEAQQKMIREPKTISVEKTPQKRKKGAIAKEAKLAENTVPSDHHYIAQTWKDGYFFFVLKIEPEDQDAPEYDVEVTVSMIGKYGYISAVDRPLLIFYGVMGLTYIFFGIVWLVLLACSWRELLQVHFWIGGVILLGFLEKAVFYAEYQSLTNTGQTVKSVVIFAELVSGFRRTLSRMLVIIVSLGFGIVRPRLGPAFHKVLCVGGVYFILGSIEGCLRALKPKGVQSNDVLVAAVPLLFVDVIICGWIFLGLKKTYRTLTLTENFVKLSVYKRFTFVWILAVVASVIYLVWSIIQHKMKTCITSWNDLWVDDAFWHLLFSIILLVIMVLWRPTPYNLRFAFSPLLEEVDETKMNDTFEGMKLREKQEAAGSPKQKSIQKELLIRKQFQEAVQTERRQYKALKDHIIQTTPENDQKDAVKKLKEEQVRKLNILGEQYENIIAEIYQQQEDDDLKNELKKSSQHHRLTSGITGIGGGFVGFNKIEVKKDDPLNMTCPRQNNKKF